MIWEDTFGMAQQLTNWIVDHSGIALGVVFLILILLGIPFIFKLKNKRNVQQEISRLKNDLMVWKRLDELSKGGEVGDKAKAQFSTDTEVLKELFKQGISDLRKFRYPKDHPWFIVVGEPNSGKTSLLQNEDLELIDANKTAEDLQLSNSIPVRFFNGNQATLLDIAGRIFFDRWMGGSSAEWLLLLKLIRKHHNKIPLSGITIVIPADALLADDKALTRRKVHLMSMELKQLTRILAMVLPCTVVITKLDAVTGFNKYFAELSDATRCKSFGWQSKDVSGVFNSLAFESFWEKTLNHLRDGVKKRFLSRTVFNPKNCNISRLDVSSEIFLFPENFNELKENLLIYLEELFPKTDRYGSQKNLLLEGVFFTSAKSSNATYNRQFAKAAGKAIDDAPMPSKGEQKNKSFFIRDLFLNLILWKNSRARFTVPEIFRRHLPAYISICTLSIISIVWIFTALFESNSLKVKLDSAKEPIDKLSILFKDGSIQKAILINDETDSVFNLPMPGVPQTSRIDFYLNTLSDLYQNKTLPFGFLTSGVLLGYRDGIERNSRGFLFNEVQSDMVFTPLVRTLEHDFRKDTNKPFTEAKRNAVANYLELSYRHSDKEFQYIPSITRSFLNYLKPTLSEEIKDVLSVFDTTNNEATRVHHSQTVNRLHYINTSNKVAYDWLDSWVNLSIYPYTTYGKIRSSVQLASLLNQQYLWLERASVNPKISLNQWKDAVASVKAIASQLKEEDLELLKSLFKLVPPTPSKENGTQSKTLTTERKLQNVFFANAFADYEKRLTEDLRILKKYYAQPQAVLVFQGELVEREVIQQFLEKKEKQIQTALAEEARRIEKSLTSLRSSVLFTVKKTEKTEMSDGTNVNYFSELSVFKEIIEVLSRFRTSGYLASREGIEKEWNDTNAFFAHKKSTLNNFIKNHSQSVVVKSIGEPAIPILDWDELDSLATLASESLKLYPKSDTDSGLLAHFRSEASRLSNQSEKENELKQTSIQKILGPISYKSIYSMSALNNVVLPLSFLDSKLQVLAKNPHSERIIAVIQSERWQSLLRAGSSFTREFIRYWGDLADSTAPRTSNWLSFHRFAKRSHAYEINSELLKLYDISAAMIRLTPCNILDEQTSEERKKVLAILGQRRQLLSLQYSDSCAQTLAAWAVLPSTPLDAYRVIRSKSPTEVKATLMLAAGNNTIPWWNSFVDEGTKHLKAELQTGARSKFATLSAELNRFPIARDGDVSMALSSSDMQELAIQLGYEEEDLDTPKNENKGELPLLAKIKNVAPELMQKISILKMLTEGESIDFEVVFPNSNTQKNLSENYSSTIPSAVARYRYVLINIDGRHQFVQTTSSGNESRILGSGDLEQGTLKLEFHRFSDAKDPGIIIEQKGLWTVLALYLKSKSFLDKDKRTWWCPLLLKDKYDEESVFFIGLRFSKPLPAPKSWPR